MGESACLMPNYSSHVPETASGHNEGNSIFEGSVSFGRFMSESLAWEKWSSFSHNRYLEEVEKYSTPGTVAQKKAYFEARYKRIAAKKAAALLAENNSESNHAGEAGEEERVEENKTDPENQVEKSGFHLTNKPSEIKNLGPVDVAPDAHNGVWLENNVDDMEIQKGEEGDLLGGDVNPRQIQPDLEPLKQLGDSNDLNNADMEQSRVCATEMSMVKETLKANQDKLILKDKKASSSAIKTNIPNRISKILPSPLRPFSSARPKQETSASPNSRKPVQGSASPPKSRKLKQESSATPNNLRPKQESGATPNCWKPKQESSATPKSRRPKQENSATPNSLKTRQESATTPRSWKPKQESSATPSSRKPTTDPIERRSSASKSLHMSICISHGHVHEIPHSVSNKRASPILENKGGSKTANSKTILDTLCFGRRKAATTMSLNGAPRLMSMTPPDNKRIKIPSGHTTPKNSISDKKWQSFSVDHSKSSSTSRRNAFSPTVTVGFNFKSEERAAKRKEKLEEKFNAKEAQEGKDEGERNPSQSFGFKAKPMPDFYHEKRLPRNQMKKVPVTRPKSPKLGRKQNLTVGYDASSSQPPPRPPVRIGASKNRKETEYFPSSLNKKTHENTSPNIQSR
ncbi:hypothetical protein H6P81_012476 [Aristolochia fimbriata]|uniref:TPX2 C-terminal domain-containing protein n=1 Tax=Aristolochia fimbriata TaxID=158543 RepID=A0AAV7EC09_ARIFI|nr:hypothetical protein H6P81_012476 [Aristolochia fimbriata]